MTPRQQETYNFIVSYRHERGYSPTLQEIADEYQRSKVAIHELVNTLVRDGHLMRSKHKSRSLQPTNGKTTRAAKMIRDVADRLHTMPAFQAELRQAAEMLLSA